MIRIALVLWLAACGQQPKPADQPCPTEAATPESPREWPPIRQGYVNPIPLENARPGDPSWAITKDAWAGQIEGYASRVAAHAGQSVRVMVSSDGPHRAYYSLFRLGWYGGAGARKIAEGGPFDVAKQDDCPPVPATGLVRCAWKPTLELVVTPEWLSGLYLVRLDRDDGFQRFVPFVVTDDRPADLLMEATVNTWQAYNTWGGESFYTDDSQTLPNGVAVEVSFDRPYAGDQGTGGLLFDHEMLMARFLERFGYDVTYATNLEVDALGAPLLVARGAFLSVGHDEYWSGRERAAVESARDQKVPVLFFGANDAWWKVRAEHDDDGDGNPRTLVCYKGRSGDDPVQGADRTGLFHDPKAGGDPEMDVIGVSYQDWLFNSYPWVVSDPSHFIYEGTGLGAGDSLLFLVGDEYDNKPRRDCRPLAQYQIAALSPVVDHLGQPGVAEAATYRAQSGALVFAAGTIDFTVGLGKPGAADPRVERMTANLLQAAVGLPVPPGLGAGPAPVDPSPSPARASSVATLLSGLPGITDAAALSDGSVLVLTERDRGLIFIGPPPARTVSSVTQIGDLGAPNSVVADGHGGFVISDPSTSAIWRLSGDRNHALTVLAGVPHHAGHADGAANHARFAQPTGLAIDPTSGRILVADTGNDRLRSVDPVTGETVTLAGSIRGVSDGPAARARFYGPTAVAAAPDGRIFVVSSGSARVAMIGIDRARTVVTIAGGAPGFADGRGDRARLGPQGGAEWFRGALMVSDPTNYRVRMIVPGSDAASTEVSTFAGSGHYGDLDGPAGAARFGLPLGLAVAGDRLLVADGIHGTLRAITP